MRINRKTISILLLCASAALALSIALRPPSYVCQTAARIFIQGWVSPAAKTLCWPVAIVLLALGIVLWRFSRKSLAQSHARALSVLSWVPTVTILPHCLAGLSHVLAGLVLPIGGTFLAALGLGEWLEAQIGRMRVNCPDGKPSKGHLRLLATWFSVSAIVLLVLRPIVFRWQKFDGGGDVCHYELQVKNLVEGRGLDMTDWVVRQTEAGGIAEDPVARKRFIEGSHMKLNRQGRIYSYHSFGFPLFVWPFEKLFGKMLGDALAMALIGAAALVAILASCLANGASPTMSKWVTTLTGMSYMWFYTAMSFLPEMLGFALCAWGFWAIVSQRRTGMAWLTTAVAAISCAALPFAHIRFAPLAAVLAGAFGVEGLLLSREAFWRRKCPRLTVFSAICLLAWGVLFAVHKSFFSGTSAYNYSSIAGRNPLVMWAMFADRRSVLSLVPATVAYILATLGALWRRDASSRHAAFSLLAVAATLYCCCSVTASIGGACLNGRYFYTTIPLMLPFFAVAMDRTNLPGRVWMLFLSLLPIMLLLFVAPFQKGAFLVYAANIMRTLKSFAMLWDPQPAFFDPSTTSAMRLAGSFFAISLFALSALAVAKSGKWLWMVAGTGLCVIALFCGAYVDHFSDTKRTREVNVLMGEAIPSEFNVLDNGKIGLFDAFRPEKRPNGLLYVLVDHNPAESESAFRFQRVGELACDDWYGRDLRWGKVGRTLFSFQRNAGTVVCHLVGRVVRGKARVAIQVGSMPYAQDYVLDEGPFDVVCRKSLPKGCKGVNFRLALENASGEIQVSEVDYFPCPDALLDVLGGFPETTRVIEDDVAGRVADGNGN